MQEPVVDNEIMTMNFRTAPLQPREHFVVHWAAEALKPLPPIPWIVQNLFSEGSVNTIFGDAGTKKTYSMMDCAVRIALGKPWLGHPTTQHTALIVDEENGEYRMKERLGKTIRGHDADGTIRVCFTTLERLDLTSRDDQLCLFRTIMENRAGLVILDSQVAVMPGVDENSSKDIQPIFMILRRIAEKTRAAIVLIHHAKKTGGYRGSTAIRAAVDLMLEVSTPKDGNKIIFDVTKARDVEPHKFTAHANFSDPGKFWLSSENGSDSVMCDTSKKQGCLDERKLKVVKYLAVNPTGFTDEIIKGCREKDSFRQVILGLAKPPDALIVRADGGNRGTKAQYALSERGKDVAISQGFLEEEGF